MKNKFRIQIMSDYNYEDLVSLVYYNEVELFLLTQEDGFDLLRICFFSPENNKFWKFDVDEFMFILEKSKYRLNEFNDTSSAIKIIKENSVPEIDEITFEYSKVNDNISPKVNIYVREDSPETKSISLFVNHTKKICSIDKQDDEFRLYIYSKSDKNQEYEIPQWDFSFKDFQNALKKAKKILNNDK